MSVFSPLPALLQAPPSAANSGVAIRRAPDSDEWLVILPDEGRADSSILIINTRELRSFDKFGIATLERCWPPRLLSRAQWRALLGHLPPRLSRNGG